MGVGALVVLTGAMFNVVAPLLATGPLHAGGSGYSVLMALYGLGMVAGSWTNARAGSNIDGLRRRWLVGIALSGVAMAVAALAPNLPLALIAFTFIGLGENLLVGPEMRLVQELVTERLLGRVFGLKDVLENIAFVCAFLGAGALLSLAGVRAVFVGAGVLTVALAAVGAVAFRTRRVVGRPALEAGEYFGGVSEAATIGVGMLGYGFMGGADTRARLARSGTCPGRPRASPSSCRSPADGACGGRRRRGVWILRARHRWRRSSRTAGSACSTTPVRTASTPIRASPPRSRSTSCARSRSGGPRTSPTRRGSATAPPASSTCARSTIASFRDPARAAT